MILWGLAFACLGGIFVLLFGVQSLPAPMTGAQRGADDELNRRIRRMASEDEATSEPAPLALSATDDETPSFTDRAALQRSCDRTYRDLLAEIERLGGPAAFQIYRPENRPVLEFHSEDRATLQNLARQWRPMSRASTSCSAAG
jgi:hypothetical protein